MKKFHFLLLITSLLVTSSCAYIDQFRTKKVAELDYLSGSNNSVKMDIKKFFNGDIEAFGITRNIDGKITGTNTAKISGKWEGNKGVVQYDFTYDDGSKDSRTWLITLNSDNTFSAIGHDVSSPAQGKQAGNSAQLFYSLSLLNKEGGKREVKFEDRMYLVDDKSMILISTFNSRDGNSGTSIISLKK